MPLNRGKLHGKINHLQWAPPTSVREALCGTYVIHDGFDTIIWDLFSCSLGNAMHPGEQKTDMLQDEILEVRVGGFAAASAPYRLLDTVPPLLQ